MRDVDVSDALQPKAGVFLATTGVTGPFANRLGLSGTFTQAP